MKNKLVTINDDEEKNTYNPIVKVETTDGTYIIYTLNEVNECGETICYAGMYEFENKKQVLKPVSHEKLEFLDGILMQVTSHVYKKESSE